MAFNQPFLNRFSIAVSNCVQSRQSCSYFHGHSVNGPRCLLNTFDFIFQLLFTSTFRGRTSKSNCRSALFTQQRYFTSKFSYLSFSNLTHETETETANRWETTNSNPHGPIIMIGESETGRKSQIRFMTLFFWNVLDTLQCFVPATAKCANMQIQNHFSQANQHVLTFPHPILIYRVTHTELCWSCCSKLLLIFLTN